MAITATLVGGQSPQLVQIVVSATTAGVAWVVTGSAGGATWTVPGGVGVGDGQQLVLVDNRAPLNTPAVYTYTPATGSPQVSAPVEATSEFAVVLQSLDGQTTVGVDLLDDSDAIEWAPMQALFYVPGRENPVMRYDVTSGTAGALRVGMDKSSTAAFRALAVPGAPVLVRRQDMDDDMPLVFVAAFTSFRGRLAHDIGYRQWALPFVTVDDPFLDARLGAFSWTSGFDAEMAGRSWDQFDSPTMVGRTWDQFDTLDWTAV